jgi:MYXO-CTERM domain-containing protein
MTANRDAWIEIAILAAVVLVLILRKRRRT